MSRPIPCIWPTCEGCHERALGTIGRGTLPGQPVLCDRCAWRLTEEQIAHEIARGIAEDLAALVATNARLLNTGTCEDRGR